MLSQDVLDYIEAHSQEAYELLLKLGRIPAPSGQEEHRARFCRDLLHAWGAKQAYIDEAGNVICPFGNCEKGSPLTVFMAHTDIVFPDTEPLPLTVSDGRICCPGIGDDTANAVALLMTVPYIIEKNLTPKEGGVLLVLDACEEGLGNLKGCRKLMEDFGADVREVIAFDSWNDTIDNTAIGSVRYRVCADTEGGHSYKDFGKPNAIVILADLIGRLYALERPDDVTVNAGTISGGTTVNAIAQHAEMLFEFRASKAGSAELMKHRVETCLKETSNVSVTILGDRPLMKGVDPERMHRLEEQQVRIHEDAYGVTPVLKASSTDCNIPLSMGIPAICIGCFRGGGSHTREEYVETESLKPGYGAAMETVLTYFNNAEIDE